LNYKQISNRLEISDSEGRELVHKAIDALKRDELIEEVQKGKYRLSMRQAYVIGKVDLARNGYGFIVTDEYPEDIFVSMRNLNHALHGDTVKVYLFAKNKKNRPKVKS
jgi:ribonuclease R